MNAAINLPASREALALLNSTIDGALHELRSFAGVLAHITHHSEQAPHEDTMMFLAHQIDLRAERVAEAVMQAVETLREAKLSAPAE
ncbi:hypothetical protein [Roseococcus suduntuyensis]|uniref:Uncharacterized protein n=1 Tax=Roseococcus suduntuyensis TaxID=455361 RepID=A0A840AHD9_9PROT|nr:hypothetical protein [Roseococcus suduntuyensis]MBB3899966.1 hypothetical protein [Roseococcus suduntuyensis]